ncbi:MAG: hypothetical protein M3463_13800, partial [Verrucomicrobiota bacterium]|nr:hypothetical protein [Verrucomicrobiota bacterium]
MEDPSASTDGQERSDSPECNAFVRAIQTPDVAPRLRIYSEPEPQKEVEVTAPGFVSSSAVVRAQDVNAELIQKLAQQLGEVPRLDFGAGRGAVDIQLQSANARQVKSGSVVLEVDGRQTTVPLDAATRRFRIGGLAPGEYKLRAASVEAGAAEMRLRIREGDVTRTAVGLDGSKLEGASRVRFALSGTLA